MNRLVAMTDGSQVLYIGADNYPFPVPLAKDTVEVVHFDAAAADEELQARRIGRNELSAMDACRLIANAEELYHQSTHQYTDTIVSTPASRKAFDWKSPKGSRLARWGASTSLQRSLHASAPSKEFVLHGYSFRIVTTKSGFTIFATPVNYEHSGIMSFSLGRDGVICHSARSRPKEGNTLTAIEQHDPTDRWTQAE